MTMRISNAASTHFCELIPDTLFVLPISAAMASPNSFEVVVRDDVLIGFAVNLDPVIPIAAAGVPGTAGNWVLSEGVREFARLGGEGDEMRFLLDGGMANVTIIINFYTQVATGNKISGGLR